MDDPVLLGRAQVQASLKVIQGARLEQHGQHLRHN